MFSHGASLSGVRRDDETGNHSPEYKGQNAMSGSTMRHGLDSQVSSKDIVQKKTIMEYVKYVCINIHSLEVDRYLDMYTNMT